VKLIVGLGNPGLRYKNTRHNIGFLAVDNFAKVNGTKITKRESNSLFTKSVVDEEKCLLLKPQTFMNNSGSAVKLFVNKFGIDLNDILVICDDVNLTLGIIRFRPKGSSGGHKGLRSVIEKLNTVAFNRLRIGVGYERKDTLKDYVLSGFNANEKKSVRDAISKTTDAIGVWISHGVETTMNRFNEKKKDGGE